MTLSEIETILEELAARHQNLHSELLSTLLQSAGWEDKNIKEALALFKQKNLKQQGVSTDVVIPANTPRQADNSLEENKKGGDELPEIKFYNTDGSEEKELHAFEDVSLVREKKENLLVTKAVASDSVASPEVPVIMNEVPLPVVNETKMKEEEETPSVQKRNDLESSRIEKVNAEPVFVDVKAPTQVVTPSFIDKIIDAVSFIEVTPQQTPVQAENLRATPHHEPQSLIVPKESTLPRVIKKPVEIPEDLPLLPFESSEQVWSFSRYKDAFHGEVMPKKELEILETKQEPIHQPVLPPINVKKALVPEDELEIDLEKTPMTRGDESLVFLAGVMLFAIILILGYMYSNGRL